MTKKNTGDVGKEAQREVGQRFLPDPDDLVFDARVKMGLSRFGRDRGAVRRELVQDYAAPDGRVAVVNRVKDGLDRMHRSGVISTDELEAARLFQRAFAACGYDRVKTTNLSGASGGGATLEDHMVRTASARAYVHGVRDMVGGPDSPMWTAVFWIVGHGVSMDELAQNETAQGESGDRKVWSGFVRSALYLMGRDLRDKRKDRGK